MFDKMAISVLTAFYAMKAKYDKYTKNESGMETIETVILIAIAVVIAGVVMNLLIKGGDGQKGLIQWIFEDVIIAKLKELFGV
ncbi:MAG: hypothetical protein MJ071_07915 [Oscillospiraceae bacterium]|nr:hypothetical protein [Oscillospiraceae bacterium]